MTVLTLISNCILLAGLGIAALEDLRSGKISLVIIISVFITGFSLQAISGHLRIPDLLLGSCIGVLLLVISFLSKGALGMGDALMFISSGACLGLENNLWLLLMSFAFCSAASVILMIVLKYNGKSRVPFIPFMLTGYICLLMFM